MIEISWRFGSCPHIIFNTYRSWAMAHQTRNHCSATRWARWEHGASWGQYTGLEIYCSVLQGPASIFCVKSVFVASTTDGYLISVTDLGDKSSLVHCSMPWISCAWRGDNKALQRHQRLITCHPKEIDGGGITAAQAIKAGYTICNQCAFLTECSHFFLSPLFSCILCLFVTLKCTIINAMITAAFS